MSSLKKILESDLHERAVIKANNKIILTGFNIFNDKLNVTTELMNFTLLIV